jgi:CRP-like cAMP-binding protein
MDTNLIKQAAIFSDLDDEELKRIAEICKEQSFKFGQNIFKEGDPGNRLFIISTGDVRISRVVPGSGEEALTVLKVGACFGEMSVFDRSERSTDAIANTDCTLLTITRSDFEILLDFNRDIAYKVLWRVVRLLSERLRVTNDNLRSFLAMSMF